MFRLTVLFAAGFVLLTAMSQSTEAQIKVPPPKKTPVIKCEMKPVLAPKLDLSLETTGTLVISRDLVRQVDNYEQYLKELGEWHRDALIVAQRLEKENKLYPAKDSTPAKNTVIPGTIPKVSPIHNWRRMLAVSSTHRIQFPESIINEMRAPPESVTPPSPTEVNLQLVLTNSSDKELTLNGDVYCDICQLTISLEGPDVYRIPNLHLVQTMDWRTGEVVKLKPDEVHKIELKKLSFGRRGVEGWCLRRPGKHEISVQYLHRGQMFAGNPNSPNMVSAKTTVEVQIENEPQ